MIFIVEKSVQSVISEIYRILGTPVLPPYWSLGYHLCRWGYSSAQQVIDINNDMRDAKIPVDVQWVDIDYMDEHKDFTIGNDAVFRIYQSFARPWITKIYSAFSAYFKA